MSPWKCYPPAGGGPLRTASTDDVGTFALTALEPGAYDVTFTLPGFREVVRTGVEIRAGAATTLDVEMAVQIKERVVVVGSRAQPRSVTASPVPIDAIPLQDIGSLTTSTTNRAKWFSGSHFCTDGGNKKGVSRSIGLNRSLIPHSVIKV